MFGKIHQKWKHFKKSFIRSMKKKEPVYVPVYHSELLKGKHALITGGTRGIGFAIAKAFINSGASVVITGRSKESVDRAVSELNNCTERKESAFGIVCDNKDCMSFKEKFKEAVSLCGKLEILVNNAGIISGGIFGNFENVGFDKTIETNLKAPAILSEIVAKYMIEKQISGNILNICSSSSLRPAISPYTISKWGLRGLTLGMAKTLIPHNIVVNGLAPGPTATEMLVHDDYDGIELKSNPAGRYATAEEIANMAVVLVSSLGRMVVGDIIYMTGGAGLITYDDMSYEIF